MGGVSRSLVGKREFISICVGVRTCLLGEWVFIVIRGLEGVSRV